MANEPPGRKPLSGSAIAAIVVVAILIIAFGVCFAALGG